jgi:hypothetical protein
MNPETMSMDSPSTAEISRQMDSHSADGATQTYGNDHIAPLLPQDLARQLQASWSDVQAGFVDAPREAVRKADELVATAMKQLADTFARERSNLENQWDREGDVSTEDLRVALTRYRSFFHRLLSV